VLLNAGDHPAIYADDRTGDVSGALAGKEGYNVSVLLRFTVAAEWDGPLTFGGDFFDAVAAGLALLQTPQFRGCYSGILCTIDVENDPVGTYEALLRSASTARSGA